MKNLKWWQIAIGILVLINLVLAGVTIYFLTAI